MDIAVIEKSIGFVGAILVGTLASISLKNDWNRPGLDNNVTKLLLGLMAFGCVLVILACVNVLGHS